MGRRRLQDGSHFTGRESVRKRLKVLAKTLRLCRLRLAPRSGPRVAL